MLRGIIRFAVHHATVIISLALVLLGYGSYCLSHAGLDIFPEFSAPRVVIQTESTGFTAEQTETLITQRIERHLAGLIGLESLRSESIQGLSIITAVFKEGTDIYRNRQLVGERLGGLTGEWPRGAGSPVMVPLSSASATILTIGLESDQQSSMALRDLVDWTLVPRLLAVPGVADVNVFGGDVRQLQIQPDFDRLRRHGLSLDDLVKAAEEATGMPGSGFIENANQRLVVNVQGLPATADSLENVVLLRKEGHQVTLGEVATITMAGRPPIGAAAIGGRPAIVLMVIGQLGANTLSVSRALEVTLQEMTPLIENQGIRFYPHLFRPADYIERSLENLSGHLLLGALLVVAILYAFLLNLKIALIPAIAIPLSLLAAAVTLLAAGVHLNIMVLGGLAIALGEVVDDAIIDTENIFRRLRENHLATRPRSALSIVFKASMEVRASVTYASFIVALVFLPLLTLGGVSGRLFAPLGTAYMLAILASLIVALTVTPALCTLLIGRSAHGHTQPLKAHREPPLMRWLIPYYRRLLTLSMEQPEKILGLSIALCSLALLLIPFLGGDFLPALREGHYIVHTTSLPGTALDESIRGGRQLVKEILKIDGVESASQWAGRAERGADTYGSHYSEYEVRLKSMSGQEQADVLTAMRKVLTTFPGLLFEANTFLTERVEETISGYTAPIVINLYGPELTLLDEKAQELAGRIKKIRGATDVQLRSPPGTPMIDIRLNPERLLAAGFRPMEVAGFVQTALKGRTVGTFHLENQMHDIVVILPKDKRQEIDSIRTLPLRTPDGLLVELQSLADIEPTSGRYNILHRAGQRVQTITAHVSGRDLESFMKELKVKVLGTFEFPKNMTPEISGAAIEQREARESLILHSLVAGAGVLILLVIAIGSIRHVLLTLLNLPFSLAGGVIAAWLSGSSLSVGSMVGFVTLFGITIRNAIMLVSHYRHLTEEEGHNWSLKTAKLGAEQRLPSILMTALVTALALLPIAIDSDNPGREIMGPMAAVIIGGLISSTLLTLLVLPTVLARYGHFGPGNGVKGSS